MNKRANKTRQNKQVKNSTPPHALTLTHTSKQTHTRAYTFTFTFYFFLPLVPIGVAGGHSCLSAARRVPGEGTSLEFKGVCHGVAPSFLGLPLALQPEYLVLYARRAGWFIGIRVMCPNHLTCCCLVCCRTGFCSCHVSYHLISDFVTLGLVYCFSQAFHFTSDQFSLEVFC